MVQIITKPETISGRLGKGLGQGLAETIPKEVERSRLSKGLEELGNATNLTPFQQFARLTSLPGITPQAIQSGTDLLRQQAIINSNNRIDQNKYDEFANDKVDRISKELSTATTTKGTEAALNPYIPPSGAQQENKARELMAADPLRFPSIESARSFVSNQVAADIQQSNAKLSARELEESVQRSAEDKLRQEMAILGAELPGKVLSDLQQKAVDAVVSKKMSPDEAKKKYGEEAKFISRDFSNIRSWGNLGLVLNDPKELIISIDALRTNAKKNGYQKEAADSLIGENGLTPQFAYASMYPVSEIKELNQELKELPNIQPRIEKVQGVPGLAGIGVSRPVNEKSKELTQKIVPRLARSMGLEGSPLSIAYELDKKGYDTSVWKQYLLDHEEELNLTRHQKDELQKPKPSFFGWLNNWWLKSFSGVK